MSGTMMAFVWLGIAVFLGLIEAATVALVSIWFAVGALAAMIPAFLSAPLWVQILTFLLVSAICFALTRTFFKDVIKVKKEATNADGLIGEEGVVTSEICNLKGEGKVYISGLTWSARSADGSDIPETTIVLVKEIKGVTLIVDKKEEKKEDSYAL